MYIECQFIQEFDDQKKYQYVNNTVSVMHCHHYASIFTQLAIDLKAIGGAELLAEAMEETAFLMLKKYFAVHEIRSIPDRVALAEQYFSLTGLGKLKLEATPDGGTASLASSHIDAGWIKKWGRRKKPVNHVGRGYIAGACAAVFDHRVGKYQVRETASIVAGDPQSKFIIRAV